MRKKVLILFDLEGCIGIDNLQNLYADFYLYCKECDLVLNTLSQIYSDWELTVCDCHGNGMILPSLTYAFPHIHFLSMPWSIDFTANYDYGILFGFHGHRLTKDPLAHSFRPEILSVHIGDKLAGEVSIFLNILAYHNIPCIYINGSPYIEDEISNIKCMKSYTKHMGIYKESCLLTAAYEELVNNLGKLSSFHPSDLPEYDNSTVGIRFLSSDYIINLSEYITKYDDTIYFENTMDFFANLKNLCTKIMEYQNTKASLIKKIQNYINKNQIREPSVTCTRLKVLLKKPVNDLLLCELTEIYDLVKNISAS